MNKKFKIISIIIVILLLIIGVYAFITYKNEMDNYEFKEVIKNASDIENITDKHYAEVYSGRSISIDEYLIFTKSDSDNISQEMDILREFKNKTSNQTQKEYLEIQINRLEKEKLIHDKEVDIGNQYKRYIDGEITASKYMELSKIKEEETTNISVERSKIKDESIIYIDNHPDLKVVLENLDVDEDFYLNENGGTTGNGRVYFTK